MLKYRKLNVKENEKRHLHDKKRGFKNNNAVVKSISHTINNKKNVICLLHMSK